MEKKIVTIPRRFQVNEFEFYHTYFKLFNVAKSPVKKLSPSEVELITHICCEDLDYILDKQRSKTGQTKKIELSGKLKIRPQNLYGLLNKLVAKEVLSVNGDGFFELPEFLNQIRYIVKNTKDAGSHEVHYVFQFQFAKDESN